MGFFDFLQQQDPGNLDPKTGKPFRLTKRPLSEAGQEVPPTFQPAEPSTVGGGQENPVIEDRAPEETRELSTSPPVKGDQWYNEPKAPQISEKDQLRTRLLQLQKFIIEKWDYNVPLINRMDVAASKALGTTSPGGKKIQMDYGDYKKYLYSLDPEAFFSREAKQLLGEEKKKGMPGGMQTFLVGTADEGMLKAGQEARAILAKINTAKEPVKSPDQMPGIAPPATAPKLPSATSAPAMFPDSRTPIADYLDALGGAEKGELPKKLMDAMKAIGVGPDKWSQPINPQAGILRALSVLDKNGEFAARLQSDLSFGQESEQDTLARDQKESDARISAREEKRTAKEMEIRQLYASLNEQPFMKSWPGMVLYVLTALLVGPTQAARLFGAGRNSQAIAAEIRAIEYEMRRIDTDIDREEQRREYARREAARQLERREDKSHAFQMATYQHQLRIREKLLAVKQQLPPDEAKRAETAFNMKIKQSNAAAQAMKFDQAQSYLNDADELMMDYLKKTGGQK